MKYGITHPGGTRAERKEKMDEKKIEKLYEIMEEAGAKGDRETEAALRWAIFKLENLI